MEANSRPPPGQQPPVTGYPAPGYNPAQSNTGYAYPYNPNPYNPNPLYPAQRATLLRRLIAIIIGVFSIFAIISFIIWLVLRPRIPEFQVESLNVSNFSVSTASSQITGDWDVRFLVDNPNTKMTVYYDQIESFIYYNTAFLAETSVAPFSQATRNQTVISTSFASRGGYIDAWFVNGINEENKAGIVGFDVRVLARVQFTNGVWKMRGRTLRVLCPNVKIKLSPLSNGTSSSSSGTLQSGNWECRVGM